MQADQYLQLILSPTLIGTIFFLNIYGIKRKSGFELNDHTNPYKTEQYVHYHFNYMQTTIPEQIFGQHIPSQCTLYAQCRESKVSYIHVHHKSTQNTYVLFLKFNVKSTLGLFFKPSFHLHEVALKSELSLQYFSEFGSSPLIQKILRNLKNMYIYTYCIHILNFRKYVIVCQTSIVLTHF